MTADLSDDAITTALADDLQGLRVNLVSGPLTASDARDFAAALLPTVRRLMQQQTAQAVAHCLDRDAPDTASAEISWALLANGPVQHSHALPPAEVLRPGAVARCDCGRHFVLDPIPLEQTWRPVHWWDRQARRTIRTRSVAERNLE